MQWNRADSGGCQAGTVPGSGVQGAGVSAIRKTACNRLTGVASACSGKANRKSRHRASRCLWTGVLPGAVSQRGPAGGEEAAATAWYAETVVPFFCSTFGDSLARVGVRKDGFINHVFSIFSKIAHLTIGFYTTERPHSALGGRTPAEAYRGARPVDMMDTSLRAVPTSPQAAEHRHGNQGPRNQAA